MIVMKMALIIIGGGVDHHNDDRLLGTFTTWFPVQVYTVVVFDLGSFAALSEFCIKMPGLINDHR